MKGFVNNKKKLLLISLLFFVIVINIIIIIKSFAEVIPVEVINVSSNDVSYSNSDPGAWNVKKSAKWTGYGEAQITLDVDTISKLNEESINNNKDVIFVIDISGSMYGNKIAKVKEDSLALIDLILTNNQNQISIISFGTSATLLSDFTNDKEDLDTIINNLTPTGLTNYYKALVEVDNVLDNYTKQEGRDVVVLFLSDGFPCADTPNQVAQYEYLKNEYPYITINAIQYEMGRDILNPLREVSDNQYVASMDSLKSVLFESVLFSTIPYSKFTITDYIDDTYFTIDSIDDVSTTLGTASLEYEGTTPKIIWNINNNLNSGHSAKLTINVKLKNAYLNQEGLYSTNSQLKVNTAIQGNNEENVTTTDTPILKDGYKVIYDMNPPDGCNLSNVQDTYSVYANVTLRSNQLSCNGYSFKGWKIVTNNINKINDNMFIMPNHDVYVKAIWTSASISKSMDGTIKQVLLSDYISSFANDSSVTSFFDGNPEQMYEINGLRYIGDIPKNYIYFNCDDYTDTSTCEVWRIVGLFDEGIKLISPNVEGFSQNYYNSNKDGNSISFYENIMLNELDTIDNNRANYLTSATLGKTINSDYYYTYVNQGSNNPTVPYVYNSEGHNGNTSVNHKLSVMYGSDYGYTYALGFNDRCFINIYDCVPDETNPSNPPSWLNPQNEFVYTFFDSPEGVMYLDESGSLAFAYGAVYKAQNYNKKNMDQIGYRPSIYLNPNVLYAGGDGSVESPYIMQYDSAIPEPEPEPVLFVDYLMDTNELTNVGNAYRYIGSTANNYITVDGRPLRIIGIFDGQVKAISPVVYYANGITDTNGYSLLNNYSVVGLYGLSSSKMRGGTYRFGTNMMGWSADQLRQAEQSGPFMVNGNGVMQASDYAYTFMGCDMSCYDNINYCSNNCSWLHMSNSGQGNTSELVLGVLNSNDSLPVITQSGRIEYQRVIYNGNSIPYRPVVYLDPSLYYVSGDGSSGSPYVVGY